MMIAADVTVPQFVLAVGDADFPFAEDLKEIMEWPADRSTYNRSTYKGPDEAGARWAIGAVIRELAEINDWQAQSSG